MKKDFTAWTPLKEKINNSEQTPPGFHEREIWYCHLGKNIGFEQDGKGPDLLRPILVMRRSNKDIFWGIPLTSAIKKSPFYFSITTDGKNQSSAILSQIKLIDAKRLSYRIAIINKIEFSQLKIKFKELLP